MGNYFYTSHTGGIYRITCRDSLVLTSSPSRHRTRTTKETFEGRHVPCTLTRDSHFPRMGVLPAHRSRDRGRMTIHGVQCIRRTRNAHDHVTTMLRHRRLARSARTLRLAWARPSAFTSLRAHRSGASNAAGTAVAAYGCLRRTRCPGPASRREKGLPPRSALRASLGGTRPRSALRAPRVARALETQPGRQWQRTAGSQRRTDAARAGIAARGGRPHLAPRSARRSDAPSAHHLAPRSARRSERTAPRALRARGAVRGALARRAGALRPRP